MRRKAEPPQRFSVVVGPPPLAPVRGGAGPATGGARSAAVRRGQTLSVKRSRRPLLALALLLALGGLPAVAAEATPTGGAGEGTWLFRFGADDWRTLTPLDPETLADLPTAPLTIGPPTDLAGGDDRRFWQWRLSADGSTRLGAEFAWFQEDFDGGDVTFVVGDGLTGPERARFHPPELVVTDRTLLARDGRRAVLRRGWVYEGGGGGAVATDPPTWYAVDTAAGRVVATVTSGERGPGLAGEQPSWIDPAGRRLYRLVVAPDAPDPGPWPTQLVADDLATGQEVGRVDLPEVRVGGGNVGPVVAGRFDPVESFLLADVAVSPGGGRLVVAHADGAALTLIDAPRMVVERVVRLPAPVTSPSPPPFEEVDGNPFENRVRRATYAPGGDAVYLSASEAIVDPATGRVGCRALPLRRVDLLTGAVVDGPPVELAQPLVPTPDGLYAVVEVVAGCTSGSETPSALLRLDPVDLAPLARRELRGVSNPAFLAAPAAVDER